MIKVKLASNICVYNHQDQSGGPDQVCGYVLMCCVSELSYIVVCCSSCHLVITIYICNMWIQSCMCPMLKTQQTSGFNDLTSIALTSVPMIVGEQLFLNVLCCHFYIDISSLPNMDITLMMLFS